MEERLKLRHSSNNKFSKTLKRFGGMDNQPMREAFNEMVREKNALKVRTKTTVTGPAKNSLLSSGEEDSDDSDESSGDDKMKARQTAIS